VRLMCLLGVSIWGSVGVRWSIEKFVVWVMNGEFFMLSVICSSWWVVLCRCSSGWLIVLVSEVLSDG